MDKVIILNLIAMSAVILTLTISLVKREDFQNINNRILVILGIFAFFWCAGYAGVELSGSKETAIFFRRIGLMGVHGYISVEAYFAYLQTRFTKGKNGFVISLLVVPGVIIAMLLSMPGVVTFVPSEFGYHYIAKISTIRYIQIIYTFLIFLFSLIMAYIWWKEQPVKRIRNVIIALVISESLKIVGSIFDTYLPMAGYVSIPGSAIAVFFSFILMRQLTSMYNTFYISKKNLSRYVYDHANSTVFVLDVEGNLKLINDYGKYFFVINRVGDLYMEDLFELSKEEAKQLIDDLIADNDANKKIERRLIVQNTREICMVNFTPIKDKYGDVFCIICFVNDITKTAKAISELNELKDTLEKEIEEKSKEIEAVSLHSISTIANIVDNRDEYLSGHSYRVSQYCEMIAKTLGWDEERIENLRYVALLHNIGMIGISESILNKADDLTKEERMQIKMHTTIGRDVLKDIQSVKGASIATYYHHERYDGLGYPEGIKGKEIPIASRIIAVADAYDAMSHDRIYREKLSDKQIISELEMGKGRQFDPEITTIMLHLIAEKMVCEVTNQMHVIDTVEHESAKLLERIMSDVKRRNQSDNERDYLTKLWDRRGGEQRIVCAMKKQGGCLMVIDIDNFKMINDKFGHIAGDQVLKDVADSLRAASEGSIIMRLGGDEFLLFTKDIHSKEEAKNVVEDIFESLREKIESERELSEVSLSVGICFCTPNSDYKKKVDDADRALYKVKHNGKNGYMFYSKDSMS